SELILDKEYVRQERIYERQSRKPWKQFNTAAERSIKHVCYRKTQLAVLQSIRGAEASNSQCNGLRTIAAAN
ncbi:MAG: hypothetical protein MST02_16310, partial [Enterocloster clostridioformis]|nr:hypothetical protein [Enterocloster clostridioformis]